MKRAVMAVSFLVASAAFPALAQDKVFVGQLVDYTGATSFGGKYYGPSVRDAVDFVNANGGAAGTTIDMETVDYAYKIPDAIANYKRWKGKGMVMLQGWGTGDTEALIGFVAEDKVPENIRLGLDNRHSSRWRARMFQVARAVVVRCLDDGPYQRVFRRQIRVADDGIGEVPRIPGHAMDTTGFGARRRAVEHHDHVLADGKVILVRPVGSCLRTCADAHVTQGLFRHAQGIGECLRSALRRRVLDVGPNAGWHS